MNLGIATYLSWRFRLSEDEVAKALADCEDALNIDLSVCSEAFARCDSPAERLFLIGFTTGTDVDWPGDHVYTAPDGTEVHATDVSAHGLDLEQQVELGPYRVDFLIRSRDSLGNMEWGLVIEIDGHDFHERTKEQAAADRSRDRELTANGFRVIRFTGSEVYADPTRCALAVVNICEAIAGAVQNIEHRAFLRGREFGLARAADALVEHGPQVPVEALS